MGSATWRVCCGSHSPGSNVIERRDATSLEFADRGGCVLTTMVEPESSFGPIDQPSLSGFLPQLRTYCSVSTLAPPVSCSHVWYQLQRSLSMSSDTKLHRVHCPHMNSHTFRASPTGTEPFSS